MRSWLSEVRIGVVAGVTAGAVLWGVDRLTPSTAGSSAASLEVAVASDGWTPPLADPVDKALQSLARGDTMFVAIASADSLIFPGVPATVRVQRSSDPFRVYSPRSTGLRGEEWSEFATRAVPFAAAYNAVVQVAHRRARGG